MEDCYAAMSFLFDNAENLKVDRSQIAIGGDSE